MENGNAFICVCARRYAITSFIVLCTIATIILYRTYFVQQSYVPHVGANNAHRRKPRRKCREVLKHHLGCRYSQTIKVLPYPAEIFIYGLILLQFIVLETDFSHTQLYSGSLGGIVAYRSGPKTTYIRKTTLLSFSTYGYLWIKTTPSFTYD